MCSNDESANVMESCTIQFYFFHCFNTDKRNANKIIRNLKEKKSDGRIHCDCSIVRTLKFYCISMLKDNCVSFKAKFYSLLHDFTNSFLSTEQTRYKKNWNFFCNLYLKCCKIIIFAYETFRNWNALRNIILHMLVQ